MHSGLRKNRTPNRLFTDALREVRGTLSRFLSLFLLSALAVAFLAGLRTTAPDMKYTADAYYDHLNLMDLRVLSTLGLTEEDILALSQQTGVKAAEGAYTVDALVHAAGGDLIVKTLSLSERGINLPQLKEGRMPQTSSECLADPALIKSGGLALGDVIALDTGEGDYADALAHKNFTIVGVADSPLYLSIERGSSSLGTGKVSAFLLLPPSAYTLDYYTDAYLIADGAAALQCYSDGYTGGIDALTDGLKPLGERRAAGRYSQVVGEANDKLEDAQRDYDDAETEANDKLNDARQKLDDARRTLDDGWAELADGRARLARETAEAQQKIADAERELPEAKAELEQGERDYADGVRELQDGWADYQAGAAKLADGQREYDDGLETLLDSQDTYNQNLQDLQDAEREYRENYEDYQAGLRELQDGGKLLMDSKTALDSAEDQLAQGSRQSQQGQDRLDAIEEQLNQGQQEIDTASGLISLVTQGAVPSNPALWSDADQALVSGTVAAIAQNPDLLPPELQSPELLAALGQLMQQSGADVGGYLKTSKGTLDQGWAGYRAGLEELAAGRGNLTAGFYSYMDGWNQYVDALHAFHDGVSTSQDAADQFTLARVQLDDGWRQLRDGEKELDDGWRELDGAKQKLVDGQQELDDAYQKLVDGQAELDDARASLDQGWQAYYDGVAALADAKERLPRETADAQRKLDDAERELTDGEADYRQGLLDYEDGRREADEALSEARQSLNDARRTISDIENCKWYFLGRNTNTGYVSFQQDAERMGNLASVFPIIFFLVAALVCLTTMTRMVEEQRVQIGAMKAMGYGKGAISLKYIGYGFAASLLGGLAGLAVGCTLLPFIIFNAWKILYSVGELLIPPAPLTGFLSVLAAVVCVTGAAVAASIATLTAVPAALMRPKAPPMGKRVLLERVGFLWKRLSFTHKVTVRNLFRYKKRFWMTVAGIGGCTALIVTGFGLRDSIFDILEKQYGEISTYSANIGLVEDVTDDELTEISRTLDQSSLVSAWMPCHQASLTIESGKRSVEGYLFAVTDPGRFQDFIHLRHRLDQDPVKLPEEGAVITEKLADLLGVKAGDLITLGGDERVEVPVTDITENYVFHYVYLSAYYYERLYGSAPPVNLMMAAYEPDTRESADTVSASLIPLSGITAVTRIRDTRETLTKSMESVDYAVVVVIVSAAALAFVVLYNLTNINITERLRELATLKVLGFYDRELSAYVYRENVLLTVFGVLMGLVMGKYLHQWLVLTVEIDMVMFGRAARPASYLYAVLLTVLFSALVNLAAHKKLKKIDMVESLKTVE